MTDQVRPHSSLELTSAGRGRGPVGLGDALIAAYRLRLEGDDLAALTELLRMSLPPTKRRAADQRTAGVAEDTRSERPPVSAPAEPAGPAPVEEAATTQPDRVTVVEPLEPEAVGPVPLAAEPLGRPRPDQDRVTYQPPVPANQLRAALAMLLRRPRQGTTPDIDAVLDALAQQRPLHEVPRLRELSLDRGVRVVADVGASMEPYREDVANLVSELRDVVGREQVEVVWVSDSAELPEPDVDRPTLVISTLGAVQPMGVRSDQEGRWRRYATAARDRDGDAVALVPHRKALWPADIVAALRLVSWDDLANVGRGR